ncbi:MAG TPA: hypothetical protein VGB83_11115 [Actinomycetota bacterium]
MSLVGWYPLGAPAGLISRLVPDAFCGDSGIPTGTPAMYVCAARSALLNLVGPLVIAALLVVFRSRIGSATASLRKRIPRGFGFLLAPTLATTFFTMAYAGIHWETASRGGILPKKMFPAAIGLIAFATPYAVRALNNRVPALFDRRDRVPPPVRVVLALIVPLGLAYLLTNTPDDVRSPVAKEQFVILVASALGFLAFIPRGGSLRQMGTTFARRAATRVARRRT